MATYKEKLIDIAKDYHLSSLLEMAKYRTLIEEFRDQLGDRFDDDTLFIQKFEELMDAMDEELRILSNKECIVN